MKKGQLLGFVKEMGHEYEYLLKSTMDENTEDAENEMRKKTVSNR